MAAALATLLELEKDAAATYGRLTDLGQRLMAGIADAAAQHGLPLRLQGPGPLFGLSFRDPEQPIRNFRESCTAGPDLYPQFRLALLERGIHVFPSEKGLWYLSTAHTEQDIAVTLEAADDALGELR